MLLPSIQALIDSDICFRSASWNATIAKLFGGNNVMRSLAIGPNPNSICAPYSQRRSSGLYTPLLVPYGFQQFNTIMSTLFRAYGEDFIKSLGLENEWLVTGDYPTLAPTRLLWGNDHDRHLSFFRDFLKVYDFYESTSPIGQVDDYILNPYNPNTGVAYISTLETSRTFKVPLVMNPSYGVRNTAIVAPPTALAEVYPYCVCKWRLIPPLGAPLAYVYTPIPTAIESETSYPDLECVVPPGLPDYLLGGHWRIELQMLGFKNDPSGVYISPDSHSSVYTGHLVVYRGYMRVFVDISCVVYGPGWRFTYNCYCDFPYEFGGNVTPSAKTLFIDGVWYGTGSATAIYRGTGAYLTNTAGTINNPIIFDKTSLPVLQDPEMKFRADIMYSLAYAAPSSYVLNSWSFPPIFIPIDLDPTTAPWVRHYSFGALIPPVGGAW